MQKTFYRYSNCFKEKVVQKVSWGNSISEVCRRYDIRGTNTVQQWLKKYGRTELLNTVIRVKMRNEDDEIKQLEAKNKRLKLSLAEATMIKDVLECLKACKEAVNLYNTRRPHWSLDFKTPEQVHQPAT